MNHDQFTPSATTLCVSYTAITCVVRSGPLSLGTTSKMTLETIVAPTVPSIDSVRRMARVTAASDLSSAEFRSGTNTWAHRRVAKGWLLKPVQENSDEVFEPMNILMSPPEKLESLCCLKMMPTKVDMIRFQNPLQGSWSPATASSMSSSTSISKMFPAVPFWCYVSKLRSVFVSVISCLPFAFCC